MKGGLGKDVRETRSSAIRSKGRFVVHRKLDLRCDVDGLVLLGKAHPPRNGARLHRDPRQRRRRERDEWLDLASSRSPAAGPGRSNRLGRPRGGGLFALGRRYDAMKLSARPRAAMRLRVNSRHVYGTAEWEPAAGACEGRISAKLANSIRRDARNTRRASRRNSGARRKIRESVARLDIRAERFIARAGNPPDGARRTTRRHRLARQPVLATTGGTHRAEGYVAHDRPQQQTQFDGPSTRHTSAFLAQVGLPGD